MNPDKSSVDSTESEKNQLINLDLDKSISYILYLFTCATILFLWIPLIIVVFLSFSVNTAALFPFRGFTLANFVEMFNNRLLWSALWNSLKVATLSASIATVLAVLASFGIVRLQFPLKESYRVLGIIPMIIPGVILGVGLLIFFQTILGISTGFVTLVLTHSVYGFPYVMLPTTARLYTYDKSLEEGAHDLGANIFESFWDITLPIIGPAIGAGFLFAWIRSFEDFIRAFFVSGTTNVLTTVMYSMIKFGATQVMNPISTLILVVITLILIVFMFIGDVTEYV